MTRIKDGLLGTLSFFSFLVEETPMGIWVAFMAVAFSFAIMADPIWLAVCLLCLWAASTKGG